MLFAKLAHNPILSFIQPGFKLFLYLIIRAKFLDYLSDLAQNFLLEPLGILIDIILLAKSLKNPEIINRRHRLFNAGVRFFCPLACAEFPEIGKKINKLACRNLFLKTHSQLSKKLQIDQSSSENV